MDELAEYKEQLNQVNEALQLDPDNEELKTLRGELNQLIELTQSLHPQHAASSSKASSSSPVPPPQPRSTERQINLKAGDECLAKYAADGRWYPARITAVSGSSKDPVFSVIFKGYNNTEMLRSADIKAKSGLSSSAAPSSSTSSPAPPAASSSSSSSSQPRAKQLTAEEEAERERRRKRSEKKSERHEAKTQAANQKANSWQKFAKKGAKKGYGIPGTNSMFKTPDDPLAKVGVVGAGRGMTGYGDRSKHVFQNGRAGGSGGGGEEQ
ncbi:hypothetical protein BDZ90DRAFT_260402 [Jaminaea rosea]|uniref:Tudor domain-containing protein n=1 Tax=Jaminaea rosea TaxID=1569628 RepID=A0A316UPT4_9BASI|nr:hypothetical protein BDZ90DRAFT_260402 [Jaminaea rosea]PWN27312.1 hypothetical protein BDZ90DRAFT_260402 [Jaminaea rosea]